MMKFPEFYNLCEWLRRSVDWHGSILISKDKGFLIGSQLLYSKADNDNKSKS